MCLHSVGGLTSLVSVADTATEDKHHDTLDCSHPHHGAGYPDGALMMALVTLTALATFTGVLSTALVLDVAESHYTELHRARSNRG